MYLKYTYQMKYIAERILKTQGSNITKISLHILVFSIFSTISLSEQVYFKPHKINGIHHFFN